MLPFMLLIVGLMHVILKLSPGLGRIRVMGLASQIVMLLNCKVEEPNDSPLSTC